MARQLRIDYADMTHHITARGNERRPIFRSNADRLMYLAMLGEAVRRYGWILTAWVFMTNHVHLVIRTTRDDSLSRGIQWLHGKYAEWFNHKYDRVGHLFQGRLKSRLIEEETYMRTVLAYVVLNPVAARMVERPEDYRWSSYRATAGLEAAPEWLAIGSIQPWFGTAETWRTNYREFVAEQIGCEERLWDKLSNQIYLGSESWLKTMRKLVERKMRSDAHPAAQRNVGRPVMDTIINAVGKVFGIDPRLIRNGHGGLARKVAAWVGWYEGFAIAIDRGGTAHPQ
jgi:putative transposase